MRKSCTGTFLFLLFLFGHVYADVNFVEVHKEKGLDFIQQNGPLEKRILTDAKGGGVSVADVNNDGWDDIYFCNGRSNLTTDEIPTNQLFINKKDGTFFDATDQSGLGVSGQTISAMFGDYDNDGDVDVYLCNIGANQLFQNNGDGTFQDVSSQANIEQDGMSTAAAWGDVNGDGYLDLFVCNYADITMDIAKRYGVMTMLMGQQVFLGPLTFQAQNDVLYINQQDGTFRDETKERGIETWEEGRGLGVRFMDVDADGDLDCFIGNDMTSDSFYINDGTGHFQEQALLYGLGYTGIGMALATMGIALADIDHDRDQDLLIAGYEGEVNTLYRNDNGMFVDITTVSNAGDQSKPFVTFGALFGDWNSDGFMDIFYANGHVYPAMDQVKNHLGYKQTNQILVGTKKNTFKDISDSSGPDLLQKAVSRGAATADFDHDGDLDIVVNNLDDAPSLLENQTQTKNNWIQILPLNQYGSPAYGTIVDVQTDQRIYQHVLYSSDSFCSQSSAWLHFGLGESSIQSIHIRWSNGIQEEIEFTESNKHIKVLQQEVGSSNIELIP